MQVVAYKRLKPVHFLSCGYGGFVLFTCYSRRGEGEGGKGGLGAGSLVAGFRAGRPVRVLPPWDVIEVAATWPMGTQPPLGTRALTTTYTNK